MGLDMYLEARQYVASRKWDNDEKGDLISVPVEAGVGILQAAGLDKYASKDGYGVMVSATAIYWRKVNSIHQWFVDNCGNGEDNCQEMYVPTEKLVKLKDIVDTVLKSKNEAVAQEYLPTQAGFFFGSQNYDEYYWGDLEYTQKELERLFALGVEGVDFYYQASW